MNKDQRGYLTKTIKETYNKQKRELESMIPDEPSLNNYIVAAIIRDELKFNDFEAFKKDLVDGVKMAGGKTVLVSEESEYDYKRSKSLKRPVMKINPAMLFVIPEGYKQALQKYADKKNEVEKALEDLEQQHKTLELKINISSNAVMDRIVQQVEDLGDLDLIESRFMLGEAKYTGNTTRLLEGGDVNIKPKQNLLEGI